MNHYEHNQKGKKRVIKKFNQWIDTNHKVIYKDILQEYYVVLIKQYKKSVANLYINHIEQFLERSGHVINHPAIQKALDMIHRKRLTHNEYLKLINTEPIGRQQNGKWQQYRNRKLYELLINGLILWEVNEYKEPDGTYLCLDYHKQNRLTIHQLQGIVKKGLKRIDRGEAYNGYSAKSFLLGMRLDTIEEAINNT